MSYDTKGKKKKEVSESEVSPEVSHLIQIAATDPEWAQASQHKDREWTVSVLEHT